ncbi:MAG: hypothetical protein AB3N33_04850 [Puniceicoccaceae bacterium]
MFFKKDLGKEKGERLAVNLAQHSFTGSTFQGYPYSFQDAQALGIDLSCDVVVCGVDNGKTRVEVSSYYRSLNIPVVFIALDWVGESGYCFVQAPEEACFGCKFPNTMSEKKAPCRTPASVDIVLSTCAFATYAVDSLIMSRKRNWNYREVHLAGFMDDCSIKIAKSDNCSLCGNPNG